MSPRLSRVHKRYLITVSLTGLFLLWFFRSYSDSSSSDDGPGNRYEPLLPAHPVRTIPAKRPPGVDAETAEKPHQGVNAKINSLEDSLRARLGMGQGGGRFGPQRPLVTEPECPNYEEYAAKMHHPLSDGPLQLAYQRPKQKCRTFNSSSVEIVIQDMKSKIVDKDLARLFENCFPNTLDTTIRWHALSHDILQTFVVTGDINAEWLRDSARQLSPYQALASKDPKIRDLIKGAINTQASFVSAFPYCNAFQPPVESKIKL